MYGGPYQRLIREAGLFFCQGFVCQRSSGQCLSGQGSGCQGLTGLFSGCSGRVMGKYVAPAWFCRSVGSCGLSGGGLLRCRLTNEGLLRFCGLRDLCRLIVGRLVFSLLAIDGLDAGLLIIGLLTADGLVVTGSVITGSVVRSAAAFYRILYLCAVPVSMEGRGARVAAHEIDPCAAYQQESR